MAQPGLAFSYADDVAKGHVTDKPAAIVVARGGVYPVESDFAAMDFQKPYLEAMPGFIGFTDVSTIVVEPTLAESDVVAATREAAVAEAQNLAERFAAKTD